MNEKETKTTVLDEALLREIVSEGEDLPEGESRLVKIDPEARDPAGESQDED